MAVAAMAAQLHFLLSKFSVLRMPLGLQVDDYLKLKKGVHYTLD